MIAVKKQKGITLFETLIVLVVGSAILYLSMQQYYNYKYGADVRQLEATVDAIFQGMSSFYKANCSSYINPANGSVTYDVLHPNSSPANPYSINIATQIQPYMPASIPRSPFVNNAGGGTGGFFAQFNRFTYPAYVCTQAAVSGTPARGPDTSMGCASGAATVKGTVILWRSQVAINLASSTAGPRLKALTDANCLSNLSGSIITPCASSTGTGSYLVWERQSINASPYTRTTYWPTKPVVAQFAQMYGEFRVNHLISASHSPEIQYYLCGG